MSRTYANPGGFLVQSVLPGSLGGHRVSTHAFVAAEDMILIPEKFVCMGESRLIGENVTAPRLCATRCMRAEGSLLVW